MKEIRGLKFYTLTAVHTSTSCKYNNGVYVHEQSRLHFRKQQSVKGVLAHGYIIGIQPSDFVLLKKNITTPPPPPTKQRNKRPHKSFSSFQVMFLCWLSYQILLLLYGAEMSCFFLSRICYVYLMWKNIKSYLEKKHQHSFNPRIMTLHKNRSLKNIKHTKKPIINKQEHEQYAGQAFVTK